jgi:methylmalonyl-CoA/ethylmalonyl-CoA epimerase
MNIPENFVFHHIGCATQSIEREYSFFSSLGYASEDKDFSDEIQGIRGCFLVGAGPRVELLENLPGSRTLTPWLNAGIKFYHFAYFVTDIDVALIWARKSKGRVVVLPVPAVAFGGRLISFVMFRNGMLVELIEQ